MKRHDFFFIMAAMMLLTACSEKSDLQGSQSDGRVPLTLTAGGSTATPMRAASNLYTAASGFDGGEQVKVWMYKNEEQGTETSLYDVGTPAAGVSELTLHSGESKIFYPTGDAGIVTLYGAYPTTSLTSHTVKYDQTNTVVGNANYKASDLMYAKTDAAWTNATEKLALKPNLAFEHQLCKLTLTVVKTKTISQIEKVRMVNTKRSVPVSAITRNGMTLGTPASATGESEAEGDNKDEILLLKEAELQTLDEETYVYSCVFVPQEWSDDAIFEVDADGATAYFRTTKVFQGGQEYGTTLNISGASMKITSTIEDWLEGSDVPDWSDIRFSNKPAPTLTTAPVAKAGLLYDGTAQELITAGVATNGTMKYYVENTSAAPSRMLGSQLFSNRAAPAHEDFSEDIPTGTEAGTYSVWYYIQGDDEHSSTSAVSLAEIVISQRPVTLTAKDASIFEGDETTYGTTTSGKTFSGLTSSTYTTYVTASTGTAEGLLSGHYVFEVKLTPDNTSTVSTTSTLTPSAAVIYNASSQDVTSNYAITYVQGTLNVKQLMTPGDIVDDGDNIKVYTSSTAGYKISKSDSGHNMTYSNDYTRGRRDVWQAIFKAVGGSDESGFSVLNDAVSNAGINDWEAMYFRYWSSTQASYGQYYYFDENGWSTNTSTLSIYTRRVTYFSD